MNSVDPREAQAFRFVRRDYAAGEVRLVYAFDDGPELIECIGFPHAPDLPRERQAAFDAALDLLHWIAGVSYYKAGVPAQIRIESAELDAASVAFLDALYVHGLGEFGFHNKIDLRARIRFPLIPVIPAFAGMKVRQVGNPRVSEVLHSDCRAAPWCRLAAARIRWSASSFSSMRVKTPRRSGSAVPA